jgi:hypothetical protein
MNDDAALDDIDSLFVELTELPVTPPPWSSVVDRIVVVPAARPARRLGFGWSAVVVGAVVALLVGIAGAVSRPVRETVFEPVANLFPWVDSEPATPEGPGGSGVNDEPAPSAPEADRSPVAQVTDEPVPDSDRAISPTDSRPGDLREEPVDSRVVDSDPTRTSVAPDDATLRDLWLRRLEEQRRREREAERSATTVPPRLAPTTTTPSDGPTDTRSTSSTTSLPASRTTAPPQTDAPSPTDDPPPEDDAGGDAVRTRDVISRRG